MYREIPKTGELYKHFKGMLYQIVTIAKHSETGEELVIYQKLYDDYRVHARPLDMFMSEVDRVKYPQVEQKYRFEKVEPSGEAKVMKDVTAKEAVHKEEVVEVKAEESIIEEAVLTDTYEGEMPNSDLLEFLNAETYEQKRNVLVGARHRITDRLIDDIAASMDVVVEAGEVNTRYESLLACITTRAKFEITRN